MGCRMGEGGRGGGMRGGAGVHKCASVLGLCICR